MGSIPITRSIPRPCRASCGNSGGGKFLIVWAIPWPEPVGAHPCHCCGLPGMAPAFALRVALGTGLGFQVRIRGRDSHPSTHHQPTTRDRRRFGASAIGRSGLSWICSLGHRMSGSPSSFAASAKVRRQRRFNALQGGDWQRNPAVWKHDRPSHLASCGQISDSHEARSKIPAGAREIARSVAISRPCQHAFATHEADVLVHVRQLVLRLLSY